MPPSSPSAKFLDELIELLSSMRFAISLLTLLAIASVVGMVIPQNEPPNVYLNRFGQLWDPVFSALGLYSVYSTAWFIAILAFLVLSTTLCIIRQFSPLLREIRSFREHAREASLRGFALSASLAPTLPPEARCQAVTSYLSREGFRLRVNQREGSTLVAAKKGHWGHIGYFLAHGAIVLICLGGLLDGNLLLSMQIHLAGKVPTSGNQLISQIPPSAWLDTRTKGGFRGNVSIPQGQSRDFAVIASGDGILLQRLPFHIELKHFNVEYYANGMPKRYTSDVLITDKETGEKFEPTIEVNKPFKHRGIALYQSAFDDAGSVLHMTMHHFWVGDHPDSQPINAEVGGSIPLGPFSLEFTDFKPVNVESMGRQSKEDRSRNLLGSAAATTEFAKDMNSLGPSFSYRLRNSAGQTQEFINYMQPILFAGRKYLFSGTRSDPQTPFSFARIPLDEDDSASTWFAIRRIFFDPKRHGALVKSYLSSNKPNNEESAAAREGRKLFAENTLAAFTQDGWLGVTHLINTIIPEKKDNPSPEEADSREQMLEDTIILSETVLSALTQEAWKIAREAAGKSTSAMPNEMQELYIRDALAALNQTYFLPFYLQLDSFEHRQATVLQAARSPGKPLVYLGSLFLALGVFAMLYIRERRLFVLLKENEALVAVSSDRKSIDLDETFARHRDGLAAALGARPT